MTVSPCFKTSESPKLATVLILSALTLITANTLSRMEKNPASARLGDLKRVCDVLELDILEVIKSIY